MEKVVAQWVIKQGTDWWQQVVGKLAPLYDTFIGYGGDYVEMQWDSSTTECEMLVLYLKLREPNHRRCKLPRNFLIELVWICDSDILFSALHMRTPKGVRFT
jgi:hypothetical protein